MARTPARLPGVAGTGAGGPALARRFAPAGCAAAVAGPGRANRRPPDTRSTTGAPPSPAALGRQPGAGRRPVHYSLSAARLARPAGGTRARQVRIDREKGDVALGKFA